MKKFKRNILLSVLAVLIVVFGVSFWAYYQAVKSASHMYYVGIMNVASEKISKTVGAMEMNAMNEFDEVEKHLDTPESVIAALESKTSLNPEVRGYFAAFEPDYFPKEGRWFEPYVHHVDTNAFEMRQVGSARHDYHKSAWYIRAKDSKESFWSDPYYYFDGTSISGHYTTFVKPIYDKTGRLACVCGADMTFEWLAKEVEHIDDESRNNDLLNSFLLNDGGEFYTVVINRDGSCIATPEGKRVALTEEQVGHSLELRKSGTIEMNINGVNSMIYYTPIDHVDWYVAVVVPDQGITKPMIKFGIMLLLVIILGMIVVWLMCRKRVVMTLAMCCGMTAAMAQTYQVPVSEQHEKMQTGRYEPTWQSLETHQTPEWFRDAKFGIWAHWGPQCVEGSGDWMARGMYIEGNGQYKYHVEHYGHPSEFGFKDILPLFKAEKWDPEALVERYKRCGAKYFFVLGNHHDNYDLWDSQYQPWNSKNIGPHKDILDGWAKAAKKAGLPLGISFHADHAWTWYEPAQRYDQNGPKAGVYYDGKLKKEDGKGKWWEGYDPQMLYQQDHPMSDRSWSNSAIHSQWGWENGACPPSPEFVTNFYDRTLDAINRYNPDLIYFDVTVLPFYPLSDCGMKIATHLYNKNPRGVVFGKILNDEQKKALTWDVERGAPNAIMPEVWQTCNCIGDWHYNTRTYERGYRTATNLVKQLVDIVSKNGNLLLNIPLRADGTYDEKEAQFLDELEAWMTQNGESIFGTRPWVKFGEGPVAEKNIAINAQGFNEGQYNGMDYRDVRFNQTKKYLYVTAMGWPQGDNRKLVIKSLAKGNPDFRKSISSVYLLGYGKIKARQTSDGLEVNLPEPCNKIAPVLRINR